MTFTVSVRIDQGAPVTITWRDGRIDGDVRLRNRALYLVSRQATVWASPLGAPHTASLATAEAAYVTLLHAGRMNGGVVVGIEGDVPDVPGLDQPAGSSL